MRVLLKKKGKLVLVDMDKNLYEYLKQKRNSGTFASDSEIKKTGITSFVKIPNKRPKKMPKKVRSYGFGENDYFSDVWWPKNKRKFGEPIWDFYGVNENKTKPKKQNKTKERKFSKRRSRRRSSK